MRGDSAHHGVIKQSNNWLCVVVLGCCLQRRSFISLIKARTCAGSYKLLNPVRISTLSWKRQMSLTLASAAVIGGHAGYNATAATCIGRIQRGLASCQACQSFHNDTVTALGSVISAAPGSAPVLRNTKWLWKWAHKQPLANGLMPSGARFDVCMLSLCHTCCLHDDGCCLTSLLLPPCSLLLHALPHHLAWLHSLNSSPAFSVQIGK